MRENPAGSDTERRSRNLRKYWFWGPYSPHGWGAALAALVVDQGYKWWMLLVYDMPARGRVAVTSFFDLVMVWNPGVSYGLFRQETFGGRMALAGFAFAAVIALGLWLSRSETKLCALSIGLIMGGALGNAIDRLVHGAVADFFSFHAFGYGWYVFNLADVAIVAGVVGLIYDSLFHSPKKASKPS